MSLLITTTNCNPHPKEGDADQWNEHVKCRNPEGKWDISVHLISPDWGKQTVDNHRRVFYENIDGGYDVLIHSEEDENI